MLPKPAVALITPPGNTPAVLVKPVIVALQFPVAVLVIEPTVPVKLIVVGQVCKAVEKGIVGAPGSIGITFRPTVNIWAVVVVFVKFNVGFCVVFEEIEAVVPVSGFEIVHT